MEKFKVGVIFYIRGGYTYETKNDSDVNGHCYVG
jgi:hypothetical protein